MTAAAAITPRTIITRTAIKRNQADKVGICPSSKERQPIFSKSWQRRVEEKKKCGGKVERKYNESNISYITY
jgi:hypothetical protein